MSLLIQNGTVVTASSIGVMDVLCEGEKIVAVADGIDPPEGDGGGEVVDATGKYVFPGFIDPHVHVHLPFMGTHAKDTWESASRAALVGGTTTLIEMICPSREDSPREAYEVWRSKAEGLAACDYSFHMGVTQFDDRAEAELRSIVADGVASFKVFLAYKGALGVSDEELFRTLSLARELGVITTAHCENETLIAELQSRLLAEGKTGPEWHEPSRPPRVEAEGVNHLMTFAELTGAAVYVVHTSCREALAAADAARSRGVRAWVEVVVPHLVLDDAYAKRGADSGHGDFEGAKYVMSPPLRPKHHQTVLWDALQSGAVSTVATDHAPFDFGSGDGSGQKEMGRGDFTKIPNGLPSVEDRINLLYTRGVAAGQIDLNTLVDCASTQAAKRFGLFPRKGTIAPGADADLVIYDPDYRGAITAATHQSAVDYNPFEGFEIAGRPSVVTVRGRVMVRDGEFVGEAGHGEFLPRTPTY